MVGLKLRVIWVHIWSVVTVFIGVKQMSPGQILPERRKDPFSDPEFELHSHIANIIIIIRRTTP